MSWRHVVINSSPFRARDLAALRRWIDSPFDWRYDATVHLKEHDDGRVSLHVGLFDAPGYTDLPDPPGPFAARMASLLAPGEIVVFRREMTQKPNFGDPPHVRLEKLCIDSDARAVFDRGVSAAKPHRLADPRDAALKAVAPDHFPARPVPSRFHTAWSILYGTVWSFPGTAVPQLDRLGPFGSINGAPLRLFGPDGPGVAMSWSGAARPGVVRDVSIYGGRAVVMPVPHRYWRAADPIAAFLAELPALGLPPDDLFCIYIAVSARRWSKVELFAFSGDGRRHGHDALYSFGDLDREVGYYRAALNALAQAGGPEEPAALAPQPSSDDRHFAAEVRRLRARAAARQADLETEDRPHARAIGVAQVIRLLIVGAAWDEARGWARRHTQGMTDAAFRELALLFRGVFGIHRVIRDDDLCPDFFGLIKRRYSRLRDLVHAWLDDAGAAISRAMAAALVMEAFNAPDSLRIEEQHTLLVELLERLPAFADDPADRTGEQPPNWDCWSQMVRANVKHAARKRLWPEDYEKRGDVTDESRYWPVPEACGFRCFAFIPAVKLLDPGFDVRSWGSDPGDLDAGDKLIWLLNRGEDDF
jgi:hypothetical protein